MVELAVERQVVLDQMAAWTAAHEDAPGSSGQKAAKQQELNRNYHALAQDSYSNRKTKMESVAEHMSNDLFVLGREGDSTADQVRLLNRLTAAAPAETVPLANLRPAVKEKPAVAAKKKEIKVPAAHPPDSTAFRAPAEEDSAGPAHRSVTGAAEAKQLALTGDCSLPLVKYCANSIASQAAPRESRSGSATP